MGTQPDAAANGGIDTADGLWERADALQALDRLVADSAHRGRVALITGEAGLGKSSVLRAFAERNRRSARVLWGYCDRLVTPRALGPLHDISRQVDPALGVRLTRSASAEDIFSTSLTVLAGPAQRARPVLAVEDAHWADEGTLDWLAFLSRRIDRMSALLIITYRDDEVSADHPLRRVLATMPSAIVHRIALPPLSGQCVAQQAQRAGRSPESVYRLAGGNPLLVTELLKSDDQAVPGAVQDLILDRLRALPVPARDVAQLVAVVPGRAEFALVADAAELVDVCTAAGVLVATGEGVAFRHELLRTAVEDALAPARRIELHGRVLKRLTSLPGVDPSRLVHHARAAGDSSAILEFGPIAGAEAARQGAHREAANHYHVALRFSDRLTSSSRATLLEQYAVEAHLCGQQEEALQARNLALALREALGQPELVGENLRWISQLAWWTGRAGLVRSAADRAVAVLEALPPTHELAMAYISQAQVAFMDHRLADSITWAERARSLAQRLDDEDLAVHAQITADTARLSCGDIGARSSLEEIHRRMLAEGRVDPAARALISLATVVADELAMYAAAEELMERALQFSNQHNLEAFSVALLGSRSKLRLERGDWEGALTDAAETLAQVDPREFPAVLPLVVQGRIQNARGDPQALPTLDRAASAAERTGDVSLVVAVADARSEHFFLAGDPAQAQVEARQGLEQAGGHRGLSFVVGRLAYRLWRAGGKDPILDNVAEPYRLMIDGLWSEAAAQWASRGGTYLQAEALALGDEAAATAALRLLNQLGATRVADGLRAQLRKRGVAKLPRGPRRATAANAAGLTARQLDVLTLVADGLSNAEIAARLTLSTKTVDHHVSALLAKLGVATRGQAAAAVRRGELGTVGE
jgi:DNA-binding CsgD family transcriptional regulator/tetratricopeptide (TPR) repeat protein/type II secretory pathway predicted ATPase ExeA